MKIIYTCNLGKDATGGDKNLFYGKNKNIKNLTVEEVLQISLQDFYRDKDIKKNLSDFLIDFKNSDEFQVCYLDALHKLPRTAIKNAKDISGYKDKINNIVLIAKRNQYFWGEFNAAAIFCDLNISSDINKNVKVFFEIRRVEFLDLPYLEKNDETFVELRNVEFEQYDRNKEYTYYEYFKTAVDFSVLAKLEHCINVFSDDDESYNSFSNDVNKLNLWKRVIRFLFDFIDDESNNVNYLFSFEPYNINDLLTKNFYLFSKQKKLNASNLINFSYSKDESLSLKVKTTIKETISDFSTVVANKINEKNDSKNLFVSNILAYNNELKTTEKQIEEILNSLKDCEKNINIFTNELNKLKVIKQNLLDKSKDEEYEFSKKEQKELEKISEEIKKISKEIDVLNKKIETLNTSYQNLEDQRKDLNEKITKVTLKIKSLTNLISDLNLLKSFFDDDIYNAFKVSISLASEDEEINFAFNQETFYDLEKADGNLCVISEDVNGFRQKIKRYHYAIKHAIDGNYRNPYLLYSINETPNISVYKELPNSIIEKYQLNEKQKNAVKGAISTRDTFYIQGPPGTGKTQVISAISEIIASKNKNILMTSSTHEAISNFFDRLNDATIDDPNIIMLKNKVLQEDKDLYSESHLYLNFIDRIKTYITKEKNKNNSLLNKIEKIKNLIPEKIWDNNQYLSTTYINELVNKLFNKESLTESENYLVNQILEYNAFFNLDDLLSEENDKVKNYFIMTRDKKYRIIFSNQDLDQSIINDIKQIHEEIYNQQKKHISIKEFYNIFNYSSISKSSEKVKEFFSTRNREKIKGYEKEFKDYILDNNLINIIGITTTSNTEISIEKRIKNLFFEYPIDTVIVDEISKSSTPEILARVILSKKVIFAGDYKQLPPSSDVDESIAEKIVNNDDYLDEIMNIFNTEYYVDDNENSKLNILRNFENLFKTSFFSNQVKKIKNRYSTNRIYEFLNVQHRFSEKIMNLVNINYEADEKLKMPKEHQEFKKYGFTINGKDYTNYDTILVDTTNLSKEMNSTFLNHQVKTSKNKGFDQKKPIIYKNFSQKESGLFNEYNALVDLKICNELINYLKSKEELKNKIGIICLTANQKKLIRHILKTDSQFINLKEINIKIDTIDNFQGREKEIIIVDFVRAVGKYENGFVRFEDKRNLDFISSVERNNVALSRAKNKLILVGSFDYYANANTISNIKTLSNEYIKKCEKIILD